MAQFSTPAFSNLPGGRSERPQGASPRNLSVAIWCGLALAAIIAYSRNAQGKTLSGDNHFIFGILIAGFAAIVSLFGWVLARQSQRASESGFWQLLDGLCTLVPPSVIGITILPISSEWRIWLLGGLLTSGAFLMVTMGELSVFAPARPHRFHRREFLFNERSGVSFLQALRIQQPAYRASTSNADSPRTTNEGDTLSMPRAGKVQYQLRRLHTRNGEDRIEAKWKLQFAEEAKRATVHIPFTPSFSAAPAVELSVPDDCGVTVKTAEVMPYGIRLEARRRETGATRAIVVTLSLTAPLSQAQPPVGRTLSRVS